MISGEMHDLTPLQHKLSKKWILPNHELMEQMFRSIRSECDRYYMSKIHSEGLTSADNRISEYPKGFCFEIVMFVLKQLGIKISQGSKDIDYLVSFLSEGGLITRVWGDLRGEYFQNAIQIGDVYFDVANDTVDLAKDKIETMPFSEAGFANLKTYQEFANLAEKYWEYDLYPNYYFPQLMSYLPLISVSKQGAIRLESPTLYMIQFNIRDNLQPAKSVLFDSIYSGRVVSDSVLAAINRFKIDSSQPTLKLPVEDDIRMLETHFEKGSKNSNHLHPNFAKNISKRSRTINIKI